MFAQLRSFFHDPPKWRPIVLVGYALALCMGLSTLLSPPLTIEGLLGQVLTTIWAWLIIVGSVLAASMVYTDRWLLERIGIKIAGLGLALYMVIVAWLWIFQSGNRGTQFFGLSLGCMFLLLRHFQVGGFDYAPRKATSRED